MKRSLRSWLWRVPLDQEIDEELVLHIEMRTRELVEHGMDPKAAREIVLARIGDLGQLKRTCVDLGRKREREMRLTRFIEEFRDDIRFAVRQLIAAPGFTVVAAITLALGIGVNSAIFALADAALLRPLPFPDPDRLLMVWEQSSDGSQSPVSPHNMFDWNARSRTFERVSAPLRILGCNAVLAFLLSIVFTKLGGMPKRAYVCGANAFVDVASRLLLDMGVPFPAIKTERYGGDPAREGGARSRCRKLNLSSPSACPSTSRLCATNTAACSLERAEPSRSRSMTRSA